MSQGMSINQQAFPPVTTSLIGACAVMFLLQDMAPAEVINRLILWPLGDHARGPGFYPWQLISYGFLHGSFLHILVNMFVLWMFGVQIEKLWGSGRFAFYYFFCVVGAGLFHLAVGVLAPGGGSPVLGASGGVLGVLVAFGRIYPNQMIMLLIPPVPVKAKYLVIIIGAISILAGMTGALGGIAHFAHLGGMVFGFGLLLYWESKYGRGRF